MLKKGKELEGNTGTTYTEVLRTLSSHWDAEFPPKFLYLEVSESTSSEPLQGEQRHKNRNEYYEANGDDEIGNERARTRNK